jgi:myo-inositol-1(or 4)-monophosphatase
MDLDVNRALRVAESAAREAGELILRGFRKPAETFRKGRFDVVTEYDLKSEELIRERLTSAFPTHRIIGEEGEATGDGDLTWYVDPIDGTVNFSHGHPYFAVSIGLFRGDEGLVGVVHAPRLQQTWSAVKGYGSFCNGKPCSVSRRDEMEEALCTTGFPENVASARYTNEAELGAFLRAAQSVRRCGSAALDLAFVADGTYDIYWERGLKPWDIAGGCVILLEAGGALSSCDGSQFDIAKGELVATNGRLHNQATKTIRDAG